MIYQLYVNNFLLVRDLNLEFGRGLNVLTGETGAGKSVILRAIRHLFFEKADKSLIHPEADFYQIRALICSNHSELLKALDINAIPVDDGEMIVTKIVSHGRPTLLKINGVPVSVALLKEIGDYIFEVQIQNQSQVLKEKNYFLSYFDDYYSEKLSPLIAGVKESADYLINLKSHLQEIHFNESERLRKIDELHHQLRELKSCNLNKDHTENLVSDYNKLSHTQELTGNIEAILSIFDGDSGGITPLSDCLHLISKAEKKDSSLEEIRVRMDSVIIELNDIQSSLVQYQEDTSSLLENYREIEEEYFQLMHLRKKYGGSLDAVRTYYDKASEELCELENYEISIEKLKQQITLAEKDYQAKCNHLSSERRKYFKDFSSDFINELNYLGFNSIEFKIEEKEISRQPNRAGMYSLDFLISLNKGIECSPIGTSVSGGEGSRILLALLNMKAGKNLKEIMIFDEIDSGISGKTALAVGKKIKQLSGYLQVILITHLPSVASLSDQHFWIEKNDDGSKTKIEVLLLSKEDQIEKIASMMGDQTETSLNLARELITNQ